MRIKRRGSDRDHGLVGINVSPRGITWKTGEEAVEITSWYVPDFNTTSKHDWYISISLPEVAAMLDAVASAIGGADREKIATAFAPSISSLLRIATECSLQLQPRQVVEEDDALDPPGSVA